MRETFDRRVIPVPVLDSIRACQARIPCHLGGGAALSGAYLGHRMTGDVDLFSHDREGMRALVGLLPETASEAGVSITVLRDAGHLVRARLEAKEEVIEVDIVHEPAADLEPPPDPIEGIVIESLVDLRASKWNRGTQAIELTADADAHLSNVLCRKYRPNNLHLGILPRGYKWELRIQSHQRR